MTVVLTGGGAIPLQTYNPGFSPGDKLAIGDANGTRTNEIYITRAATGMIDIYGADGSFWFQYDVGYTADDGFAVGEVAGFTTSRDEIIVGDPAYGLAVVFKAEKIGSKYQFFHLDFQALNGEYAAGDQVAVWFWRGLHPYQCSFGLDGTKQENYPNGVDVVLAINTSTDQQCSDGDGCKGYFTAMCDRTLLYSIYQMDWNEVIPQGP